MFGNTGNNNNNDRSVNTRVRTLYGETACMQLAYWNDNMSIKINPLASVSPEGLRQYDYNRRANTALTADKCLAIKAKVDEKILPAIETVKASGKLSEPVNVGVQVGTKGSAIFVEYKNDEKGTPSVFLTIFTNIGADNKAAKECTYSYKFSKVVTFDGYEPEQGTAKEDFVEAEFLFFYEKIKNISDICGTAAHSVNTDNAYKTAPRQNGNQSFSTGAAPTTSYSAPVTSFSTSDDLPF